MKVVVTGLGNICSLADNPDKLFESLVAGKSGLAPYMCSEPEDVGVVDACVGLCPTPNLEDTFSNKIKGIDKTSLLSLFVAKQALEASALDTKDAQVMPIFWGCSVGGLETLNQGYFDLLYSKKKRVRPMTIPYTMPSAPAFHIANLLNIKGPSVTISAACASSALAIVQAYKAIAFEGKAFALAGGVEAMSIDVSVRAWQMTGAVCKLDKENPEKSSRPFDKSRNGFALADGAACLILESEEHALARGAKIYGYIEGFGHTCDAEHISKPNQAAQVQAMTEALQMAGIGITDVAYLNTHGTATVAGDHSELWAIHQIFGSNSNVVVGSSKAQHGHLIGAAGALEAIVCLKALENSLAPANHYLVEYDSELPELKVPNTNVELSADYAVSNSFAFGGVNVSIVMRRANGR